MTFSYRFRYITDVKTSNYQMVAYELVQYDPVGGATVLTFPANPTHGEVVGIKNTTFTANHPINLSSANNVETHIGLLSTAFEVQEQEIQITWAFDAVSSVWRVISLYKPIYIPEPWSNVSGSVLLGTNTQIPLTYQPTFYPNPIFFQANAGNIECIRDFVGYIDITAYIEFVASANNQDGQFLVELWSVLGTPTIIQGSGLVGSNSTPRAGTFYEQRALTAILAAEAGDIVGLRGTDVGGTMVISALNSTGLYVRNV